MQEHPWTDKLLEERIAANAFACARCLLTNRSPPVESLRVIRKSCAENLTLHNTPHVCLRLEKLEKNMVQLQVRARSPPLA